MHNFSTFLPFITVLLSGLLGSVPFVSGAVIKAREGNPGVGHTLMDLEGNPLRPDFNETRTFKILQLPAGFNFSDPDLNFTRQDFGGMVAFSDSELDKIPGHVVASIDGSTTLYCETSVGSPPAFDIWPISVKLKSFGSMWCCQKEADGCTRMLYNGQAASDICSKYTPVEHLQTCTTCAEAGISVGFIYDGCTNYATMKAGGYVRYVSRSEIWSGANFVIQAHDLPTQVRHLHLQLRHQRLPQLAV
jgi:hypothetical protein